MILLPILVLLIYGVVLLQHWFVALYDKAREESFFDVITSTLITYITEHADFLNRPEAVSGYATMLPPLVERMADTTGLALLMFLSAIGCLFWLSKKLQKRIHLPDDRVYHSAPVYHIWVPVIWHSEHYTKPMVCLYILLFEHYGCVCPFDYIA